MSCGCLFCLSFICGGDYVLKCGVDVIDIGGNFDFDLFFFFYIEIGEFDIFEFWLVYDW